MGSSRIYVEKQLNVSKELAKVLKNPERAVETGAKNGTAFAFEALKRFCYQYRNW